MSTDAELPFKAMLDSWNAFNTSIEISENALNANKVESFPYLKQLVHNRIG